MATSEQKQIKKLYHAYRHTQDIDQKGLFFSPKCMQICRPVSSYAATSRDGIVQYLKDAQGDKVPGTSTSSTTKNGTSPIIANSRAKAQTRDETRQTATLNEGNERPRHEDTRLKPKPRSVYTIRPLHPSEHEFGSNTITAPVGFKPTALQTKAKDEGWIGMRVDLWSEGGTGSSLLVKVQYWWRREPVKPGEEIQGDSHGFGWRQCLHDIMYLGPKDGSEGEEGLQVLE